MPPVGTNYEKLSETLQEVLSCVTTMQANLTHLTEISEETRRTLRGSNGDVGLVARVTALEAASLPEKIAELRTDIDGDTKEPGLCERVRALENFTKSIKNAGYIVGVLLVTDIFTRLWPGVIAYLNKP